MIDAEPLLENLTPEQRDAVMTVDGPLLVVAGAGSGKTRVITRRIAYLVSQGIEPSSICAITFTNKAAGEMKHRVSQLLGRQLYDFGKLDQRWPTVCTFHSLCLRILKHYSNVVGLGANFLVFDTSDQNRLIKEAIKLADVTSSAFTPATVHGTISKAKNQLVTAQAYAETANDFYTKQVSRIYSKYQQLLKQNNAVDFDDLMLHTAIAFREHPDVLRELQDRFGYLLIDEYQDTNHAQYVLAHALAMRHKNVCVVGDPDQSIYAWRGADIQNILDFEKDYPDAKVVRLERNYRSTKTILDVASKLIAHNTRRKDKTLWTENPQGDNVRLVLCQDEYDEARIVTRFLRDQHDHHGVGWNQMAVFYRINALSRVMEDALRRDGLPYVMARGVEFYNRKEIKDTVAYLRIIANPADEVSLERVVNVPPRGIGDGSVEKVQAFALGNGIGLYEAMSRASEVPGLTTRAVNAIFKFVRTIETLRQTTGPVKAQMEKVVRTTGLEDFYGKAGDEDQSELANINELISSAAEYDIGNPEGTLGEYLSVISLVSDTDHLKDNGGAITMMTLHAAKGLEFPVVAMIGLEEGILPHSRARESLNELEEERRLCFVGITRAQNHLMLTRAHTRTIRGLRERTISSPFLGEMPKDKLDIEDRTDFMSPRRDARDHEDTEIEAALAAASKGHNFHKGQRVRHPTFGIGQIETLTPMGEQTRAIVNFARVGRKTLILEYARLEVVG